MQQPVAHRKGNPDGAVSACFGEGGAHDRAVTAEGRPPTTRPRVAGGGGQVEQYFQKGLATCSAWGFEAATRPGPGNTSSGRGRVPLTKARRLVRLPEASAVSSMADGYASVRNSGVSQQGRCHR